MEPPPIGRVRKNATLAISCLAAALLSIDLTALHLAIPKLIEDLGPSATQILWIADIYGFALAGLLITMGSVGDRIGRKRLLLIGSVAFAAASVLTAYSTTAEMLIASRALLGVAGATIMPSTLSIIRNTYTDPRERTTAVGIWSAVSASGFVIGPIVGGLLLSQFWWGSVFIINLPIMALIFVFGVVVLPESRDPDPGRLDPLSAVLSMAGVIAVVYAVKAAAADGVSQPSVGLTAVVGIVCVVLFLRRQKGLEHPLIDVGLFRRAAFSGAVATNMFAMFAMVAQSLIISQYFQLVLGWSPLKAGLAGLPGAIGGTIGGILAAPLINALGRARTVSLGMAVAAVGMSMYVLVGVAPDYLTIAMIMVPVGFGISLAFAVTGDTVLATVPKERAGSGAAISETAMEVGGALGIALLGSVLNVAYANSLKLPEGVPAKAVPTIEDSLGGALQVAAAFPRSLSDAVTAAARQAFVDGIHVTAFAAGFVLLSVAVASWFALRGVPKVIADEEPDEEKALQT
ncbi:MFS transporter [Spirillospora sp. CA-294931]|uniref:MFS transporter n=1 Tax=Spirillospora sp. CA-294931 TaxID=3240042 RepID=UPI003D8AFD1B